VFIIDRQFDRAALFAAAGAVLSYFGFIHGTALGIGASTPVAVGYLIIVGMCLALGRQRLPQTIETGREATAEGED
jgi:adenine/guanine/hypoxanthine permease